MSLNKIYRPIILALLFVGCTNDFEEINTNPNAPVDVQPSLLLRQVQWDFAEQMSYEGFVAGNLLGQYFTAIDFNLFDRHSLNEPQFGGNPWDFIYVNLRDNEILLEKAINNPAIAVYEGPSRIMKAYMGAVLTDIFGDVPYQEAFTGKTGNIAPVFDEQAEIYTGAEGILENLELGISAIEAYQGAIPLEGDILFNGDLASWIKFANSLRLKYLMRIANRVDVASEINSIFQAGNFIQTNAENASFDFQNVPPNNFRMSTARVGDYNLYIMSETVEEILRDLEDPRM
ncbi:MAG: SusD/RagB family nutrient-binding outer membrane lipoprotein, partial [Bacteroidota bacterium]